MMLFEEISTIRTVRSNANSDAGTTDAGTVADTDDTDTDATTNDSVCDAM